MARKQTTVSNRTLFTSLLLAGIVLFFLPQSLTKGFNFLFVETFKHFLNIGSSVPHVFTMPDNSEDTVRRVEYEKLYIAYENALANLSASNKKYERLAQIRNAIPRTGAGIVLADIMNTSVNALRHELVINRGSDDGIDVGQYVSCPSISIIGTIVETHKSTSRVRLVTDANHRMAVEIWREGKKERIYGQLVGTGQNTGKIPLMSKEYDIRTGDTVYAAAVAGLLETPRIIGEVSAVRPDEDNPLLLDISVKPVQDVSGLTDVVVIVVNPEK
jgi:rod shape-determining protein MreC